MAEFPIKNVRWFEENARRFERVLYHFGNSPSHKHMFDLLERQLGVVVLNDFCLGHALKWMDVYGYSPSSFRKTLYNSHGFSALNKDQVDGRDATVAGFPCNWDVLRSSIGVLVHSNQATELIRK